MKKTTMSIEKVVRCKEEILQYGRITSKIKNEFFSGYNFGEIRNWLEDNGLDRHMPLELESTEVAVLTPFGVLMQIRPTDNNQLGMWGGVLEENEEPLSGAVRELQEETGIIVAKDELEFIEKNEHYHKYDNGDQVYFKTYRFAVKFDYVPKVVTDEESVGAVMVAHIILEHQQKFIGKMLERIEH